MSESNDKVAGSSKDPVDIFDMGAPSEKPGIKGNEQPQIKPLPVSTPFQRFVSNLKPVHFIIAGVIGAGVWIIWPYVFSGPEPADYAAAPSHVLSPDRAMQDSSEGGQNQGSANTSADPSVELAPAEAAAVKDSSGQIPQVAPDAKEVALQAQVGQLTAELATAKAQLAQCPALTNANEPPKQAVAATTSRKRRARHAYSSSRNYAVARAAQSSTTQIAQPRDFTINTVYRDQAWIQRMDHTYVVQAGDVVNGLRIVRVDAAAREVITPLGIIR